MVSCNMESETISINFFILCYIKIYWHGDYYVTEYACQRLLNKQAKFLILHFQRVF